MQTILVAIAAALFTTTCTVMMIKLMDMCAEASRRRKVRIEQERDNSWTCLVCQGNGAAFSVSGTDPAFVRRVADDHMSNEHGA